MKKVIHKWYSHYEKEEKWLNALSAKGLAMTDYTWCRYVFEDSEPGEYIYRLELLENLPSHPESKSYIAFMKETGVEFVSAYGRWVYFRKKAAEGPFDIYSDMDSRIVHYKRIVRLWGIIGLFNLMLFFTNSHWGSVSYMAITSRIWLSAVNLILGGLLVGLCIPYFIKMRRLKKEKQLRE